MKHLTRNELERWRVEGPSVDRPRIVGHLAECDPCGSSYGDLLDASEVEKHELVTPSPDLLGRASRAYQRQSRPVLRFWTSQGLPAAAAAAMVAVMAGAALLRTPAIPADADWTIRSGSLQMLAPIGAVEPPVRFRWTSPVMAARYRIEVRDEEGRLLFLLFSSVEWADLPADRAHQLVRGHRYIWEVVALGERGDLITRGPSRAFVVSRGRE
jgi:hypothetical protein